MEKIKSPLTDSSEVKWEKDIDTDFIKEKYLQKFNIDVAPYFNSIDKISVFVDNNTGYKFYYPYTVSGDDKFYEKLQEFDWYYMPWKWEHQLCAKLVNPGDKVLEVGCAKGDFLQKLKELKENIDITGLELNESAVNVGKKNDLNIKKEFVEEHAKKNKNFYDVVCSFQVLEHISEVKSFIQANIDCAKKGGKIVFSVPNNDSFTKYDWKNDILNMPPHHMGLWDKTAFMNIANFFKIKLLHLYYEPLQEYHLDWYTGIFEKKFLRNKLLSKMYKKFNLRPFLKKIIQQNSHNIHGHSIVAVYEKTSN